MVSEYQRKCLIYYVTSILWMICIEENKSPRNCYKLFNHRQSDSVIDTQDSLSGTMEQSRSVDTLKTLTSLLRHLNLVKGTTTIGYLTLPNVAFFVLHVCSISLYIVTAMILCVEHKFDLNVISGALCVSCGDLQIILIFICWTINRSMIEDSVVKLRALVNKRKWN